MVIMIVLGPGLNRFPIVYADTATGTHWNFLESLPLLTTSCEHKYRVGEIQDQYKWPTTSKLWTSSRISLRHQDTSIKHRAALRSWSSDVRNPYSFLMVHWMNSGSPCQCVDALWNRVERPSVVLRMILSLKLGISKLELLVYVYFHPYLSRFTLSFLNNYKCRKITVVVFSAAWMMRHVAYGASGGAISTQRTS